MIEKHDLKDPRIKGRNNGYAAMSVTSSNKKESKKTNLWSKLKSICS